MYQRATIHFKTHNPLDNINLEVIRISGDMITVKLPDGLTNKTFKANEIISIIFNPI